MPEQQKRTTFIKVMLTPDEKADLQAQAWALDTTPSNLIRALISLPKEIAEDALAAGREAKKAAIEAKGGRTRVLVFDKTTYDKLIFQIRRYGYHYDGCLKAMNTIAANLNWPRRELREQWDEALDHLRRVDVAKDELLDLAYMLIMLPSVQLDKDTSALKEQ